MLLLNDTKLFLDILKVISTRGQQSGRRELTWNEQNKECIKFNFYFSCVCLSSVLQDTKVKIQKMKVYEEELMECLGDILEKHIPHPQNGPSGNKKKKVVWAILYFNTSTFCKFYHKKISTLVIT